MIEIVKAHLGKILLFIAFVVAVVFGLITTDDKKEVVKIINKAIDHTNIKVDL